MTSKLAEAISLAALAHEDQVDKNGEPYILHCLRVMLAQTTEEARIVGVLHDLLEDTSWTAAALIDLGFGHRVVQAIEALTRREDETYFAYLDRVAGDELARKVKMADVQDNLRPLRAGDQARHQARYIAAMARLAAA